MPAHAQALQRGHHQGSGEVHGGHRGGHGEDGQEVHPGAQGEDAGARDLPTAGLYPGQTAEGEIEVRFCSQPCWTVNALWHISLLLSYIL